MDAQTLHILQQYVFEHAEIQHRLQNIAEYDEFIAQTLQIAAALNLNLTNEDLRATMQQARRTWVERWLV